MATNIKGKTPIPRDYDNCCGKPLKINDPKRKTGVKKTVKKKL